MGGRAARRTSGRACGQAGKRAAGRTGGRADGQVDGGGGRANLVGERIGRVGRRE